MDSYNAQLTSRELIFSGHDENAIGRGKRYKYREMQSRVETSPTLAGTFSTQKGLLLRDAATVLSGKAREGGFILKGLVAKVTAR